MKNTIKILMPRRIKKRLLKLSKDHFPLEIMAFLMGRVEGQTIYVEDIEEAFPEEIKQTDSSVCLSANYVKRVTKESPLDVVGSFPSHPFDRDLGHLVMLGPSVTDITQAALLQRECPLLSFYSIVSVIKDGKSKRTRMDTFLVTKEHVVVVYEE